MGRPLNQRTVASEAKGSRSGSMSADGSSVAASAVASAASLSASDGRASGEARTVLVGSGAAGGVAPGSILVTSTAAGRGGGDRAGTDLDHTHGGEGLDAGAELLDEDGRAAGEGAHGQADAHVTE